MHVAVAPGTNTAVAGPEVEAAGLHSTDTQSQGEPYRCLLCGAEMSYTGDTASGPFDYFRHVRVEECVNDGNVSAPHRLAQELVAMRLFNWLPMGRSGIGLERRVGTASEFIIADVLVEEPVQVAVEIVYQNTDLRLRRRLSTLFKHGYTVMVVCVTSGALSPTQVEQHLNRVARVEVGRFDPDARKLELGSVVSPTDVCATRDFRASARKGDRKVPLEADNQPSILVKSHL